MDNKNASKEGLPFSQQQARRVLTSPEGQKLLQLLNQDGGNALRQAAQAMRAGDYTAAQAILGPLMQSPQAQQLIEKLNEKQV